MIKKPFGVTALSFFLTFLICPPGIQTATGTKAMAATAHPYATAAALEILKNGGNAVDAAIAAQWVLNVVEPQSSGIGGGGFFLFYDAAKKKIYSYDGREKAPRRASPEMFFDPASGKPYPFEPARITGGLPVGVPGVLKLLNEVHQRHGGGKFSFARLFDTAARLAENGFEISPRLARFLVKEENRLELFPETRRIFFDAGGRPRPAGHLLKQPDLARTFHLIQKEGMRIFYDGEIAQSMVKTIQEAPFHPGLMELSDLKNYRPVRRPVLSGNYRGYEVFSMGPPSSGGTTLVEALNILGLYPLAKYGRTAEGFYYFSRAQRLAFEDRDQYLGDPDFVKIPVEKIISKEFARQRAKNISEINPLTALARSDSRVVIARRRSRRDNLDFEKSEPATSNTSHISIADESGNMVSFTTTLEALFGCGMVVPGRGFFLNNQLTDFEAVPKDAKGNLHPNAPGPGKRPRSSMTPAFIFHDGNPFLIVGSPGGSRIIGAVLNVAVNLIDFGMTLDEALQVPRMINRDGIIEAEEELFQDQAIKAGLEGKGAAIKPTDPIGNVQAVHFDSKQNIITGESDPRGEGEASGY